MLSIRRTWHDDALKSVNFPDNTNKARCVHSNKSLKKKKKKVSEVSVCDSDSEAEIGF